MTLVATARKLEISFYAYIHDRISGTNQILPLATLVERRTRELILGDCLTLSSTVEVAMKIIFSTKVALFRTGWHDRIQWMIFTGTRKKK